MSSIDNLFANLYAIVIGAVLAYGFLTIFLAARGLKYPDQTGFWTDLAILTIRFGNMSGRAQLLTFAMMGVQAAVFYAIDMSQMGNMSLIGGLAMMVFATSIWMANCKLHRGQNC